MNKKKKPDAIAEERERNDSLNKSSQTERGNNKTETKLPGEYPPNEDIMNRRDTTRVGIDENNFSKQIGQENFNKTNEPIVSDPNRVKDEPDMTPLDDAESPSAKEMERPVPKDLNLDEDDIEITSGNESDVTKEDLEALGPKDLSLDMGEDENVLKNRVWPVDMAGEDLDVPGTELDDDSEAIGSEDEENNYYSLGGDRLEDNLEGK
jgi:hypothetical protein